MPDIQAGGTGSEQPKTSLRGEVYDWLQCIVTALVISILVFVFVGRIIGVDGDSMNPTLLNGERVIMSNLFFTPKQGDIVVLTKESFDDDPIVKRIIATEGQTVDINFETGEVWVDGQLLDEPYIAEKTHRYYPGMTFPLTVEEGCVFVMGDNRNKSTDSRSPDLGTVDTRCILGKVYAIIYPFSEIGWVTHG